MPPDTIGRLATRSIRLVKPTPNLTTQDVGFRAEALLDENMWFPLSTQPTSLILYWKAKYQILR